MKNIIASYPAYDVVEAKTNAFGVKWIEDNMQLVRRNKRLSLTDKYQHLSKFTVGCVVGYAVKNNDCPIEAIERAKKHGHEMYWLSQNASCITSHKQARKEYVEIATDDIVYFQGKLFKVYAQSNGNLGLEEVEATSDGSYMNFYNIKVA